MIYFGYWAFWQAENRKFAEEKARIQAEQRKKAELKANEAEKKLKESAIREMQLKKQAEEQEFIAKLALEDARKATELALEEKKVSIQARHKK